MGYAPGDLKVFNPNKEVAKEITLEILIRHRDALKQARNGDMIGVDPEKVTYNDKVLNQVRGLKLIISAQREMITISRPILFFKSTREWKKKYKEEGEQEANPFKEHENDYNKILGWLDFLSKCAEAIVNAERTKSLEDDFMITRDTNEGKVNELTNNFNDMVEDLESSYEQIYLLMLINKIVSAGIEEDEETTYKEKEKEGINRVLEA